MSRVWLFMILTFTIVSCQRPPGGSPPPHDGGGRPTPPEDDRPPHDGGGQPPSHHDEERGSGDGDGSMRPWHERSDEHSDESKEKSGHKKFKALSIAAIVLAVVAILSAIGCIVYTKTYKAKLTKTDPIVKTVKVSSLTEVQDIPITKKHPLPDIPYRKPTPPSSDRIGIASPPPSYDDMTALDTPWLTSLYTDVTPSRPPVYSKFDDVLRVNFSSNV